MNQHKPIPRESRQGIIKTWIMKRFDLAKASITFQAVGEALPRLPKDSQIEVTSDAVNVTVRKGEGEDPPHDRKTVHTPQFVTVEIERSATNEPPCIGEIDTTATAELPRTYRNHQTG